MAKRTVVLYLQDIFISITSIEEYTKGLSFENFSNDKKTIDAVVRNIEIIGEAARNIPKEFTVNNPQVPWGRMISMRNKVIHEYFGVDLDILWKTINEDLPELKNQLRQGTASGE